MTEVTPVETVPVRIKETKEMLIGALALAQVVVELMKDGFQVTDLTSFWLKLQTDAEFKAKLVAAYENYSAIPEEVKHLNAEESFELIGAALPEILKLIKSFKK
jgi:hypothetical protein